MSAQAPRLSLLIAVDEPGTAATSEALARTLATILRDNLGTDVEVVLAIPAGAADLSTPRGVRVVTAPRDAARQTAAGLGAALDAARGRVVGVLAPGDVVEPGVLPAVIDLLDARPELDVLYTDEQWPGRGAEGIATKPGWAPEYLRGTDYLGRLCVVRRDLLVSVGGFDARSAGAEEWDAHLRVTEATERIAHVPVIGVSRPRAPRVPDGPATAAVQRHLDRRRVRATVENAGLPGTVRVWREIDDPPPLVSIVIPTVGTARTVGDESGPLVSRCVRSLLERTTYEHWEVVLVTSEATATEVVDDVRSALGDRLVVAPIPGAFSFSDSINEGARWARGDLLLLLNDDTEAIEPRWLERMVSVLQDPSVGVVGAKLLFADGRIQHLGVAHNDAWEPSHPFMFEQDGPGHGGMGVLDLDYPAVTGACLLTRASTFREVGGLCQELPLNYNDVDFCFKVRSTGLRVVSTPYARLTHHESASRTATVTEAERAFLRKHWTAEAFDDPFVPLREIR